MKNRINGYSLIETIIVCGIFIIIAAIVLPKLTLFIQETKVISDSINFDSIKQFYIANQN